MNIIFNLLLSASVLIFGGIKAAAVTDTRANNSHVIDFLTARDLEIASSVNEGDNSVVKALDTTKTSAGAQLLRFQLMHPLTDRLLIEKRQHIIKQLVQNPEALKSMEQLLSYAAVHQEALSFFDATSTPASLSTVVQSFLYKTSLLETWNQSVAALNTRHVFQSFSPLITAVFEFLVLHYAMEYLQQTYGQESAVHHKEKKEKHKQKDHGHKKHKDHVHDHNCNCIHHAHAPENAPDIVKVLVSLAKAGHIALHLISIKDMVEFISAKMAVMNQVFQQLVKIQKLTEITDQLLDMAEGMGFATNSCKKDTQLLTQLLGDGYFSEPAEKPATLSLFSPVGQTLVSYIAVQEHNDHLKNMQQAIAEIDVYCAIARLVLDSQHKQTSFCFVDFIEAESPQLMMTGGWHVMLDHAQVVANDFVATKDTCQKFVLTGPNRSGKSSFLRTLGVNVVLAQTFGIAAAKHFSFTLVHKILSFMTITDDMAAGQSSFVARMMRADACLGMQKALPVGQFALVLLDDSLGQATSVELGERMAYDFVKQMGASDQNILVSATHISKLINLARETVGRFTNIRMKVIKNETGGAEETYVLEPGVSLASDAGILVAV